MPDDTVVLRGDDERCSRLLRDGWTVTARSWAARLDIRPEHLPIWTRALDHLGPQDTCRELRDGDASAVLRLDAATAGDYPGSVATAHEPVTAARATPTPSRRGFGVFDADRQLVAMTFVDTDGDAAEVDFTVVAPQRRGQGLAAAVKAASLLAVAGDGVVVVRTGGSDDNSRILAANLTLGFQVDEHWTTLTAPRDRAFPEGAGAPGPDLLGGRPS